MAGATLTRIDTRDYNAGDQPLRAIPRPQSPDATPRGTMRGNTRASIRVVVSTLLVLLVSVPSLAVPPAPGPALSPVALRIGGPQNGSGENTAARNGAAQNENGGPGEAQNGAPADRDLAELRRSLLADEEPKRDVAAIDLVRAGTGEADALIREIFAAPLTAKNERAILSLLKMMQASRTARFVPEILELSLRSNGNGSRIREAVRTTLLGTQDAEAVEARLAEVFQEERGRPALRVLAVSFLRELRSLASLEPLIGEAIGDPPPGGHLRDEIVRALETITGERFGADFARWRAWLSTVQGEDGTVDRDRARAMINEALRRRTTELGTAVLDVTRRYLDRMASRTDEEDVAFYRAELGRLLSESPYEAVRAEAASRFFELGPACVPRDLEMLLAALSDPAESVRVASLRSLGKLGGDKAAAPEYAELMARLEEALLLRIGSEFPREKVAAVEAAGRLDTTSITERLIALLRELIARPDSDSSASAPGLRAAAVRALEGAPPGSTGRVVAVIARVLEKDPVTANRKEAAAALGRIGDPSAVPPLRATFEREGERGDVRWQAADSLGRIGGAEAVATLTRGLRDPVEGIRAVCVRGLGLIGDPGPAGELVEMLADEPSSDVRSAIVVSLGSIGDESSVSALERELRNGDSRIASAAETSLEAIFGDDPVKLLEGGERALGAQEPKLASFAARVLTKAGGLLADRQLDEPARFRQQVALADAHRLLRRVDESERLLRELTAVREQVGPERFARVTIGLARCRALRGEPFQAARGLEEAASTLDPTHETYWRHIAAAARILVHAAAAGEDETGRRRALAEAARLLGAKPRPPSLTAGLVAELDRWVGASDGVTPAEPEISEEEATRIEEAFLALASNRSDPESYEEAAKSLEEFPIEKQVAVLIDFLGREQAQLRRVGIEALRKEFPEANLVFDPEAPAEARRAAVETVRAWWYDRRRAATAAAGEQG